MKKIILLIFTIISMSSQAQSPGFGINDSERVPKGLLEGTIAPDFSGIDQNGNQVSLNDQLKKGPVVLIFYRGYWCPVCNRYLSQFQNDLKLIVDKGASVIAVSPEENDGVNKTVAKNDISFSVLTDPKYTIMDQYGVRFLVTDEYAGKINSMLNADIATNNGDDKPYLPVPATYIIGQDGKITRAFFDLDYHNRPVVPEIVKYLN